MKIAELSQTVAFRLTLLYSLFFASCVIMLLGFVYWQTAAEMTRRVDQILSLEKTRFDQVSRDRLPDEVEKSVQRDLRHIYYYALFDADGRLLAGNAPKIPVGIALDGSIREVEMLTTNMQGLPLPARLLVKQLGDGERLLIGHDVQQLIEFGEIMRRAIFWGGSLTILFGLIFGLVLSFRPLGRVKQIQRVCEQIALGSIKHRLPISKHRDELDMLSAVVNKMLDEIERLMSEAKSVGDHIAHDLRTPLTRLRAVLYRMQQQVSEMPAQRAMADQVVGEVDSLLLRFRALLRISEIENHQRRAGFKLIRLSETLDQAVNFVEPLAEDKGIRLSLITEPVAAINGDGELLFEAVVNLLDNAIKFTPAGGSIEVRLSQQTGGAKIDIIDTGVGISKTERTAVLNRFYRGANELQASGFGLGLSIVMAIIRLHDFKFELGETDTGTRATIYCRAQGG